MPRGRPKGSKTQKPNAMKPGPKPGSKHRTKQPIVLGNTSVDSSRSNSAQLQTAHMATNMDPTLLHEPPTSPSSTLQRTSPLPAPQAEEFNMPPVLQHQPQRPWSQEDWLQFLQNMALSVHRLPAPRQALVRALFLQISQLASAK